MKTGSLDRTYLRRVVLPFLCSVFGVSGVLRDRLVGSEAVQFAWEITSMLPFRSPGRPQLPACLGCPEACWELVPRGIRRCRAASCYVWQNEWGATQVSSLILASASIVMTAALVEGTSHSTLGLGPELGGLCVTLQQVCQD